MEIAVVLLTVLAAGLAVLAGHQRRQLVDLRGRVRLPDAPASTAAEQDAIVIVIHNHHEVAADRTPLARGLSALSPGLVRSIVHRETMREVRARLDAEGIDADVRVRRIVPHEPHDPHDPSNPRESRESRDVHGPTA